MLQKHDLEFMSTKPITDMLKCMQKYSWWIITSTVSTFKYKIFFINE